MFYITLEIYNLVFATQLLFCQFVSPVRNRRYRIFLAKHFFLIWPYWAFLCEFNLKLVLSHLFFNDFSFIPRTSAAIFSNIFFDVYGREYIFVPRCIWKNILRSQIRKARWPENCFISSYSSSSTIRLELVPYKTSKTSMSTIFLKTSGLLQLSEAFKDEVNWNALVALSNDVEAVK